MRTIPQADIGIIGGSGLYQMEGLKRIKEVRRTAHEELMCSLACAREVVSLVYLARVTGASASRADQIAVQLASAVRSLSKKHHQQLRVAE